jgi:hypothetical protein
MQEKPGCRILDVGIETLRDGDKPDSMVLQRPDVVQAVRLGSAEAVKFPDQEALKFPCHGVGHEPIQPWAAGLGTAHGVLVSLHDLPALAVGVVLDFAELKLAILIGGADASVGCFHRLPFWASWKKPELRRNREHFRTILTPNSIRDANLSKTKVFGMKRNETGF